MLPIEIQPTELYDDINEEYVYIERQTLQLEHSLISISKWESKWHKPFFSKQGKTTEEVLDYVRCMTINKNVKPNTYLALNRDHISKINNYIEDPMTATTFSKNTNGKINREQITSELIYYWMIKLEIPVEFERWHIKRLLTLIKVFEVKDTPHKKMSKQELIRRNTELNAQRRAKLNSKG